MNADEKAVAEEFPCTCGHMFVAADYGHVVGCTAIGEVRALALAARIRAEASGEAKALRNQRDKYANLARQHGATVPTADEDEDEIDSAMQKETP